MRHPRPREGQFPRAAIRPFSCKKSQLSQQQAANGMFSRRRSTAEISGLLLPRRIWLHPAASPPSSPSVHVSSGYPTSCRTRSLARRHFLLPFSCSSACFPLVLRYVLTAAKHLPTSQVLACRHFLPALCCLSALSFLVLRYVRPAVSALCISQAFCSSPSCVLLPLHFPLVFRAGGRYDRR